MRAFAPFKASGYLLTGKLWARITDAKVLVYVQRCVYEVVRSLHMLVK